MPEVQLKEKIKFTYSDYLLMPNERKQYQLIKGDFYMTPAPRTYHQIISGNIFTLLKNFSSKNKLGQVLEAPTDVLLSKEDVVQPDILFISKDRLNIITEDNIQGAPDLVIEILSETTKRLDLELKPKLYARHCVKEYWIVDPDKKIIELLYLTEEGYKIKRRYKEDDVLESEIIPNFKMKIKEVFKREFEKKEK